MKFYKKAGIYKNSTGTNYFNPSTMRALSYDWWCYFKVIDGSTVFNAYRYSNTTARHQSHLRSLLEDLGIEIDHIIEAPKGLDNLESALELYKSRQSELQAEIDRPRSHKAKNEERRELKASYKALELLVEYLMKRESLRKGA